MAVKLSVITVTYNNEDTIDSYLKTFQFLPDNSEVIIVDNNSHDRTVEKLRHYKTITVLPQDENLGFGKSCNIGVKHSKGEYLLFLNPDTKLSKNGVSELIKFYDTHPDAGIVAPKLEEDSKTQPSVRKLPTIIGALKEYYLGMKGSYEAYAPFGDQPIAVESVVGAAVLMKRDLFNKIGGFSSKYFMYFEDLELCRQVLKQGFKVYYVPSVIFYHKVGASFSEKKNQWIQEASKKYHGYPYWLLLYLVLRLRPKKGRV